MAAVTTKSEKRLCMTTSFALQRVACDECQGGHLIKQSQRTGGGLRRSTCNRQRRNKHRRPPEKMKLQHVPLSSSLTMLSLRPGASTGRRSSDSALFLVHGMLRETA